MCPWELQLSSSPAVWAFLLRGMAGTGPAHDAAEISFNLPDDGESDTGVAAVEELPTSVEKPTENFRM